MRRGRSSYAGMPTGSLKARFVLIAALVLLLALTLAWAGLGQLFERHVERRADLELQNHIRQLAAQITIDPRGQVQMSGRLADPRFGRALSGLYWQIDPGDGAPRLHSVSLLDAILPLPPDALTPGRVHRHQVVGPGGQEVLVLERLLLYPQGAEVRRVRIAVALDIAEIQRAARQFSGELAFALALLGGVLLLAAGLQVHFGLVPVEIMRRQVEAVRAGTVDRLTGPFPTELAPLAEEMNALLGQQEEAVARARNQAGDLAHGLKTPLTVLKALARRLRVGEAGDPVAAAGELDELADTMSRHVDHVLARARLAARPQNVFTQLAPALHQVIRTLRRTPQGEGLDWQRHLPGAFFALPMAEQDLTEVLGNILENAARWARARVCIAALETAETIGFRIRDDGPGLDAQQLRLLGSRGQKFDTSPASSGLGLAIARDIVEAYGGAIHFQNANSGGLVVEVTFPRK